MAAAIYETSGPELFRLDEWSPGLFTKLVDLVRFPVLKIVYIEALNIVRMQRLHAPR